jgi:hypothetical protein
LLPALAVSVWRTREFRALATIMVVSLALRIVLVVSGGQFYWGDESRYTQARDIAAGLGRDAFVSAVKRMSNGQHPLFPIVGVIPAAIERITVTDTRIPGAFFASFSVLNIGLLALIARRSGASTLEAAIAAALLALSASFFYYARHLVPYDVAMFFGLVALWLGLDATRHPLPSVLCGVFAACAFFTYTGYWTLGGTALVIHVIQAQDWAASLRRAVLGGIGLLGTIGLIVGASAVTTGDELVRRLLEFSRAVSQGTFNEGWRLPWEYLWHAEHFLLVLWLIAAGWCLARLTSNQISPSARVGLLGIAMVYGTLVVFSVFLHKFVVYGRLARQLVPFLCLTGGAAIHAIYSSLPSRTRRVWAASVWIALVVQAAFNFATPLRQVFPDRFLRDAQRSASLPAGATTLAINARHLYPGPAPVTLPPRFVVISQAPHPLQFLPYQYEGYTPAERQALRSTDIAMRFLAVAPE